MNADIGTFELHQSLSPQIFDRGRQPTVTVIPFWNGRACLVQPAQAGDEEWWVPAQGRIRPGDGTVMSAALRQLSMTFGLCGADIYLSRMKPLIVFENPIPEERRGGGVVKQHYVVGVPIFTPSRILYDRKEVKGGVWVEDPERFLKVTRVVAEKRPVKHRGMVDALSVAHMKKFINWSVEEQMAH